MPRTGGVYSPPAGTKGTPNTTIQSVPYNTWVDDLTADANAARPITAGGTGATSASAARTALGLAIGSDVQAYDAGLQSIAGLTTAADRMIYTTASDVYATTALTPFARTLLDDADASTVLSTLGVSTFMKTVLDDVDAATARATLGLTIGTNVQAYDAGLQSIAGLTTAANQMIYTTALDAYAITALTPFARTILDDADAATVRATIGANDASNLTTGTVADALLPTSMAGKTFTSTVDIRAGAPILQFTETDNANKAWFVVVDGDTWSVRETTTATTRFRISAGGEIEVFNNLIQQAGSFQGRSATFSGSIAVGDGDTADGEGIITINSDRPWTLRQRGESATANLSFENTTAKQIGFSSDAVYAGPNILINPVAADPFIQVGGNRVWHAGNDGSGSGLDADLLDGLNAATGNTASTIVARDASGDIKARLLRSEYTSTSATCVAFMGQEVIGGVDTNNYVRPMTIAQAAALLDSALVPVGRQVIAGNGMTGGGTLAADRTLTLGTPSNITNSTTNSVTATSHTHALGFVAAEVYTGSTAGETNFPLGHPILAYHTTVPANNAAVTPSTVASNLGYTYGTGAVAALSGTWRQRGGLQYSTGNYVNMAVRTA